MKTLIILIFFTFLAGCAATSLTRTPRNTPLSGEYIPRHAITSPITAEQEAVCLKLGELAGNIASARAKGLTRDQAGTILAVAIAEVGPDPIIEDMIVVTFNALYQGPVLTPAQAHFAVRMACLEHLSENGTRI